MPQPGPDLPRDDGRRLSWTQPPVVRTATLSQPEVLPDPAAAQSRQRSPGVGLAAQLEAAHQRRPYADRRGARVRPAGRARRRATPVSAQVHLALGVPAPQRARTRPCRYGRLLRSAMSGWVKKAVWASPEVGASAATSSPSRARPPASRRPRRAPGESRATDCPRRRTPGIPMLASEEGLISTMGGDSWPTNTPQAAASELGEGATDAEQGKGAPSGGRLLPAEEVHVQLTSQSGRRRTPARSRWTRHARLAHRRAGGARGWPTGRRRRKHELRYVAVVDRVTVGEAR